MLLDPQMVVLCAQVLRNVTGTKDHLFLFQICTDHFNCTFLLSGLNELNITSVI